MKNNLGVIIGVIFGFATTVIAMVMETDEYLFEILAVFALYIGIVLFFKYLQHKKKSESKDLYL